MNGILSSEPKHAIHVGKGPVLILCFKVQSDKIFPFLPKVVEIVEHKPTYCLSTQLAVLNFSPYFTTHDEYKPLLQH